MSLHQFKTIDAKCSICQARTFCLPTRILESEVESLEHMVDKKTILKKGEYLVHAGSKFEAIFAVSSGAFKNIYIAEDGTEQITNFYFPGEIIGLNSISHNTNQTYTRALETSSVCKIDFVNIREVVETIPSLNKELLKIMSTEIRCEQRMIKVLNQKSSADKMASFLLDMSERHSHGIYSENEFILKMSRADIASYLGITNETVSRKFTLFKSKGLIEVQDRLIKIIDREALKKISTGAMHIK